MAQGDNPKLRFSDLQYYDGKIKQYIDNKTDSTVTTRLAAIEEELEGLDTYNEIYAEDSLNLGRLEGSTKGTGSVTLGSTVVASNYYSHAEGHGTTASGDTSHAEGGSTQAYGGYSHAEGYGTYAAGYCSHVEGGGGSKALGGYSHAEGYNTTANDDYAHSEGYCSYAQNESSHAEGRQTTAYGEYSHSEGNNSQALGSESHAEGYHTTVTGNYGAHAEGYQTFAAGHYAHAEGADTTATGTASHVEGYGAYTTGYYSHAEGYYTTTYGDNSHAEGEETLAYDSGSHAEGSSTSAIGSCSHAEGRYTSAYDYCSHAEGYETVAYGEASHAEGNCTSAYGDYSHAEGSYTTAGGDYAHAEGYHTYALGDGSHAEGEGTVALVDYQHVEGRLNIPDTNSNYIHIVGNGGQESAPLYNKNNTYTFEADERVDYDYFVIALFRNNNYITEYTFDKDKFYTDDNNYQQGTYINYETPVIRTIDSSGDFPAETDISHPDYCYCYWGTNDKNDYDYGEGDPYLEVIVHYNEGTTVYRLGIWGLDYETGYLPSNAHTLDWDGNAWFAGEVTDGHGNTLSALAAAISNNNNSSSITSENILSSLGVDYIETMNSAASQSYPSGAVLLLSYQSDYLIGITNTYINSGDTITFSNIDTIGNIVKTVASRQFDTILNSNEKVIRTEVTPNSTNSLSNTNYDEYELSITAADARLSLADSYVIIIDTNSDYIYVPLANQIDFSKIPNINSNYSDLVLNFWTRQHVDANTGTFYNYLCVKKSKNISLSDLGYFRLSLIVV